MLRACMLRALQEVSMALEVNGGMRLRPVPGIRLEQVEGSKQKVRGPFSCGLQLGLRYT